MGERWLSIDPGETVGWALWEDQQLLDAGQYPLVEFRDMVATAVLDGRGGFEDVRRLVIERFALYPEEARSGALDWDEMRTSRLIGALELCASLGGWQVVFQPALIKEPSEKAGAAEFFRRPLHENRHANDALRHGWFYVMTVMRAVKIKLPSGGEAWVVKR